MKIKTNHSNSDLWCLWCKEPIDISEKYVEVVEDCLGEKIPKAYHYDCFLAIADEYEESEEDE